MDSDRVLRQKRHEPASRKNPETWVDIPEEAEAMRRYRNALDSGLSDHEAREEAWPSVVQPSPQTS